MTEPLAVILSEVVQQTRRKSLWGLIGNHQEEVTSGRFTLNQLWNEWAGEFFRQWQSLMQGVEHIDGALSHQATCLLT
jgi:hypothetical protein